MESKVVSRIMLTLLLLGMLTWAFNIQPVKADPTFYVFSIVWNEVTFYVVVESNSTVSNFYFSQPSKEIGFNVTGEDGTIGFCNVTIPKSLLRGNPWMVTIDAQPQIDLIIAENATHTMLYFTYPHTTHQVRIRGTWVIGPLDTTPPIIDTPSQEPEPNNVMPGQAVRVSVNVTDADSGVKNVTLSYTTNDGTSWTNIAMSKTIGDTYEGVIPGLPAGTNVCYEIVAYDNAENFAVNDNVGYYYCYQVKLPSTISIALSSTGITLGENVTISGLIDPVRPNVDVTILHRPTGGIWIALDTVKTDINSNYFYTWYPEQAGIYEIKTYWVGDQYTLPAESDVLTLKVEEAPPPTVITATVDIDPDTLNLKSEGKWITVYIELPEGYDVNEIDVFSILLNGTIPVDPEAPTEIGDYDGDSIPDLTVKFDRAEVIAFVSVGEVTLTITGEVAGTPFEGTDIIRVIDE